MITIGEEWCPPICTTERVWIIADPEEGSVVHGSFESAEKERQAFARAHGLPNAVLGPFVWQPSAKDKDAGAVVRSTGVCGKVLPGYPCARACLLERGHDGGVHEPPPPSISVTALETVLMQIDEYESSTYFTAVKEIRALITKAKATP